MGPRVGAEPLPRSGRVPRVGDGGGDLRLGRRHGWGSALLAVLFVGLTAVVATGGADGADAWVAGHFRPMNEWGELQDRYAPWLTRLAPVRMFALLAVTSAVVATWRRSWQTLLLGVVPAVLSVGAALLVKYALARPNPLGGVSPDGGSYPSGHMLAVVVSVAACLVILTPRVRWWSWAVLLVPSSLMASALLVTASHWVSDVVGSCLLAGAAVLGTSRLLLGGRDRLTK
jgi:membrane-associated phospholipid phosphatase